MKLVLAEFAAGIRKLARAPSTTLGLLVASTMICISGAATEPTGYGDLGWQRWIGEAIIRSHRIPMSLGSETFTAAGSPWVPQEWLFAVGTTMLANPIAAAVFEVGIGTAIAAAIGLAAFRAWNRSRSSFLVSAAIVLIVAIIVPFESIRAQYVAWLLLSLSLVIVESGNARSMPALLLVSVLWANVHASVVLLPILLVIRAISIVFDEKRISTRAASAGAYALATLVCSWINPAGMRLTEFAFDLQKNVALTAHIIEWHQPTLANPIVAVIIVPMFSYGILGTVARRKCWDFLLIAFFGYLSFRAQRHLALFAIGAMPAAIAAFSSRGPSAGRLPFDPLWVRRYVVMLGAALSTATLLYVFFTPASVRADGNVTYTAALDATLALPGNHRVFCQDFSWCSYFVGHSRFEVWWDGRADAYPTNIWLQGIAINENRPPGASKRNLDRYDVDVVVAKAGSVVSNVLAASHWMRKADVQKYQVWQRPAPP